MREVGPVLCGDLLVAVVRPRDVAGVFELPAVEEGTLSPELRDARAGAPSVGCSWKAK